jgi:Aldo/keto reductase family
MQYRTLGRTGVQVSSLALGAMNFGKIGRTTQGEASAIVDAALEGGINLIDTADMYSGGESEEMVGKVIAGHQRRGDAVGPDRPAARGKDPLLRLLDLPGLPHRPGPAGRPRVSPEPLRHRTAQLLDPAARDRNPRPARSNRAKLDAVEQLAKVADELITRSV